jgi:thiamine pyrophosphokinase
MDQYKSVLCLNGELPKPSFFNKLNLPIIAADGSANYLAKNDLLPKAIVGDLELVRKLSNRSNPTKK